MKQENWFITVMTGRCSYLTRALFFNKNSCTTCHRRGSRKLDSVLQFSKVIVIDNGPQFVSKRFTALCAAVGTKLTTSTKHHPKANIQVIKFNKTLVARLQKYFNDHQTSWSSYMQLLTYSYKTQIYCTTNTCMHSLLLSQELHEAQISEKHDIEKNKICCCWHRPSWRLQRASGFLSSRRQEPCKSKRIVSMVF